MGKFDFLKQIYENFAAKKKSKAILVYFFLFLFLFSFFVVSFITYEYQKSRIEKASNAVALKKVLSHLAELEQKMLRQEFKRLISDALVMKESTERGLMSNFSNVEKVFLSIIKNKRIYDQLRYIDEKGNEIVRVDLENGEPVSYKGKELQNKANRYYFTETMAIKRGEVYVSKLDLNIEHDKLEIPIKPMIRIAIKVYDKKGKERGIVITNYCARIMLADFVNIAKDSECNAYLLNAKSYWLSNSKNAKTEFAFMYDDKQDITFKKNFPQAYEKIFKEHKDFFETDENIFFAKKVIPFKRTTGDDFIFPVEKIILGDGNLMVVLHIEKKKFPNIYLGTMKKNIREILHKKTISFLMIFLLSVLLSILIYLYEDSKSILKFYSEMDQASGVFNRRAGLEKTKKLISRSRGSGLTISLVFVDINGLKSVNDILGHQYGDELIKSVSDTLKSCIRDNDILFRYGGDEFIICLAKLDLNGAGLLWERVLSQIDKINNSHERKYNISLSHGVSIISHDEKSVDINKHIEEADSNMYEEKQIVKKTATIIKSKD